MEGKGENVDKCEVWYWGLFAAATAAVVISVTALFLMIWGWPERRAVQLGQQPRVISPTLTSPSPTGVEATPTPTMQAAVSPQTKSETWVFSGYALGKQAGNETALMVAMSEIVRLPDGRYRMYYGWAGQGGGGTGIKSAISTDGKTWKTESGFRLQGASDTNDREAVISGPSLVKLPDGRHRMYYQSSPMSPPNEPPKFHVRSAISSDGLNFTREGIRIEIEPYSKETGLELAGHGTYFIAKDGTYVGIFSGNLGDAKRPSDLVMATSKDGLTWGSFKKLYISWHDPIVIKTNEGYRIYATYLLEKQGLAVSEDGLNWPAQMSDVTFQDETGKKLTEGNSGVGDLGGVVMADGSITIYTNWGAQTSSQDIVYFEKK